MMCFDDQTFRTYRHKLVVVLYHCTPNQGSDLLGEEGLEITLPAGSGHGLHHGRLFRRGSPVLPGAPKEEVVFEPLP